MRVLIADRNARLLESISRSFAPEFAIQTAATVERCAQMLREGAFDLVIISEKLADGPGLRLLGQIARDAPDTLRVLAARQTYLARLKGKLGPLGLFRTLTYPIEPRKLASVLTLAHTGLAVDVPAMAAASAPTAATPVSATRAMSEPPAARPTSPAATAQPARSTASTHLAAPALAESITIACTGAALVSNVPMNIASTWSVRRSRRRAAPQEVRPAGQRQRAVSASTHEQARVVPQPTPEQPRAVQQPPQEQPQTVQAPHLSATHPYIPAPRPSQFAGRTAHPARTRSRATPGRSKLGLAATVAIAFLATAVVLNLTGVRATHASAPPEEISRAELPPPPATVEPIRAPPPPAQPAAEARRFAPKARAPAPDVEPEKAQVASNAPAIADPSSFGSEAYQPIYSN